MSRKILVVDDMTANRKIIKAVLAKAIENIEIVEAEDGYKAIEIIKQGGISVVILDIMMPGIDGLDVLAAIKDDKRTCNIPVIMCSALYEAGSLEKALKLGALDYFTKPLTEEQMKISLPLKIKNALEHFDNKNELLMFYEHIKDEMHLAEQIQKALITEHAYFPQGEVWGKYIPCEEVGGDMFCIKQVGEKLWFMIADISGHGISAAMISNMINIIFMTTVESCQMPDQLAKKINSTLFEVFGGSKFVLTSAFVGFMDKNSMFYVNSGHPYPVMYNSGENKVESLSANGFLLGVLEDCSFQNIERKIGEGDAILLYTDGLFDKGMNSEFAAWDSVYEYCKNNIEEFGKDKEQLLGSLIDFFSNKGGKSFIDDVAVLIVEKT